MLSWNVFWRALDDPFGRAAIVASIDGAATARGAVPFDFVAVVEASGDSAAGNVSQWTQFSATLSAMGAAVAHSGFEDIAIFYGSGWTLEWSVSGEFERGRPWLLAHFVRSARSQTTTYGTYGEGGVWVMAVHLNHFFLDAPPTIDPVHPGAVLAAAFAAANEARGVDLGAPDVALVIMGDFNEYEWSDFPEPYRSAAQADMAALWNTTLRGKMSDAVPPRTVSCCTKWAHGDRFSTNYTEWVFEYDHVFFSSRALALVPRGANASGAAAPFIPYAYPGTAAPCRDAACTGENPPLNATALHQGSWHR